MCERERGEEGNGEGGEGEGKEHKRIRKMKYCAHSC